MVGVGNFVLRIYKGFLKIRYMRMQHQVSNCHLWLVEGMSLKKFVAAAEMSLIIPTAWYILCNMRCRFQSFSIELASGHMRKSEIFI